MESITLVGMHDPQLIGSMQDDPRPAEPGKPGFWHEEGGWKTPEDVGQPLVVTLAPDAPVPKLLLDARDSSGYEVAIQRQGQELYTDLEGQLWPGQTPTLTSLSPDSVTLGGPDVTLRAMGTGFGPGSVLCLDGEPVTTTLSQTVALTADLQVHGASEVRDRQVTVRNPDGSESQPLTLTVRQGDGPGLGEQPVQAAPLQPPAYPDPDAEDPNVQAPPAHPDSGIRPPGAAQTQPLQGRPSTEGSPPPPPAPRNDEEPF